MGLVTWVLHHDDLAADVSRLIGRLEVGGAGLTIGRGARDSQAVPPVLALSSRVDLPDPYMSERHIRITRAGDVDVVQDEGSRHGTWVDGRPLSAPAALEDGALIEVGRSLLCYRRVPSPRADLLKAGPVEIPPSRTFNPHLADILGRLRRLADTSLPILLLGDRGVGKEIVARFIHHLSRRRGPFVGVDCGAIPDALLESELFGHRRGAFTTATERIGLIRSANGGTLFLDELGNLTPAAQTRLLRVLQEQHVRPVGAEEAVRVDVRWVAATNAAIETDEASFRRDLFDRLAGGRIVLPRLRERREDLGVLASHLLRAAGFTKVPITKAAARVLFQGSFDGNIRELRNTLVSAATLAAGGKIEVHHLPCWSAGGNVAPAGGTASHPENPTGSQMSGRPDIEPPAFPVMPAPRRVRPPKEEIVQALLHAGGVQDHAARLLGIHERQLRRWMDEYGLRRTSRKNT